MLLQLIMHHMLALDQHSPILNSLQRMLSIGLIIHTTHSIAMLILTLHGTEQRTEFPTTQCSDLVLIPQISTKDPLEIAGTWEHALQLLKLKAELRVLSLPKLTTALVSLPLMSMYSEFKRLCTLMIIFHFGDQHQRL